MPIKEFEAYHGAVLTKILRRRTRTGTVFQLGSERIVEREEHALTLIERYGSGEWPAYEVNRACCVYIKYAKKSRAVAVDDSRAYQFKFDPEALKTLESHEERFNSRYVLVALVCARREIALLTAAELRECLDFAATRPQAITVRLTPGQKTLRVYGPRNKGRERSWVKVRADRLDEFRFPRFAIPDEPAP